MRWAEIKSRQPRLIEFGHRRLLDPGIVLVATIRRDGTPRLSPVEPYVMDGDLWLSMMWGSTKARDLLRDPRILVRGRRLECMVPRVVVHGPLHPGDRSATLSASTASLIRFLGEIPRQQRDLEGCSKDEANRVR